MNAAEKVNQIAELSPKNMARLAGIFSLLTILGGIFAQGFVSESLIVNGDAAATATNILSHESLFLVGFRRLSDRNGVSGYDDGSLL